MKTITSFIKYHPITVFILLAYLLSWWPAIFTGGEMLLPHGPLLAVLIVVRLTEGKNGLNLWWGRVVCRDVAFGWYALAVALPLVITFMAAGVNLLMGATLPQNIDWMVPFVALPGLLLFSGMWEEPGWTGYALPRLLERFAVVPYGTLIATSIMAVIRIGWHLPLMLSGSIYWTDILLMIAAQIVFVWLFNRTRGNVLVIMLLHLMNNTISGEFVQQWFTGADWVRQSWLLAGLWSVAAIAVLLQSGLNLGRNLSKARQQDVKLQPV